MKYALLGSSGAPVAFYDTVIHFGAPGEAGSLIPADAVAIGDETWRELVDNPGRRRIVEGQVVAIPVSIGDVAKAATAEVRRQAAAARDTWRTPGKDAVYRYKTEEAAAWRAAGMPDDLTPYPHIVAEIGVTAPSAADLVVLWEAKAVAWMQASARIEAIEQGALRTIGEIAATEDADAVNGVLSGLSWPAPL